MTAREPYDEADRLRIANYLAARGQVPYDPLTQATPGTDPYFTPSILSARMQMERVFGARRPNGEEFRAYPTFIERPYANAFAADLGDGLHLCAMDVGMATILFELACYCFSQPAFFPEIGDPGVEAAPALPQGALLGYWIMDRVAASLPQASGPIGEDLIPLDLERRLMAHFLTQMMMRFTWLHELYHGLNGHAGYVASLRAEAVLREMPDAADLTLVDIEEVDPAGLSYERIRYSLEFDADRAAYFAMARSQLAGDEAFEVLAERPLPFRLKLVTFAAVLMTFLFDQSAKRQARAVSTTHPPAYLRLHNIVRTIASNLNDTTGQMRATLGQTLIELDHLQPAMPGLVSAGGLTNDLRSPAFQAELDQMDADLERVRVDMTPFAFR